MKHDSVIRQTMFMASLDIKTAFDEERPRHISKIMESHDIHGWLIAALLREMSGLEEKAMFECVESSFTFDRCLRQGSVEAPWLCHMRAAQLLASVERGETGHKKTWVSCYTSKDVDRTHSQDTSVWYSLFTGAHRTTNALGSRIAVSSLCAETSVVTWCDP